MHQNQMSDAQPGDMLWRVKLFAEGKLCLVVCLSSGRTYSLTYMRVQVEDAAEIKFVAEKAESRAQLTVKGNCAFPVYTA